MSPTPRAPGERTACEGPPEHTPCAAPAEVWVEYTLGGIGLAGFFCHAHAAQIRSGVEPLDPHGEKWSGPVLLVRYRSV